MSKHLFPLGETVMTPGALAALVDSATLPGDLLLRHVAGDWGDVSDHDRKVNDEALRDGDRLLSSYKTKPGEKIWVITEADRSVTTVLLPDEY